MVSVKSWGKKSNLSVSIKLISDGVDKWMMTGQPAVDWHSVTHEESQEYHLVISWSVTCW